MLRTTLSPTSSKGIAAIVGVGPNLGCSIARKFAQEAKLSGLAEEIARDAKAQVFAIRIDCANSKSVREAFEGVLSLGFVEVLIYNACEKSSPCPPTKFMDTTLESFEKSVAVSSLGAFQCVQQVIPVMVEKGKGTIIFTGSAASLTGFAGYCELSCGKFALRGLSQCLAREYQGSGIHIAHVIIDGAISASSKRCGESPTNVDQNMDGTMDSDALALAYWQIHVQDKGAWSQEIDLRSFSHRF